MINRVFFGQPSNDSRSGGREISVKECPIRRWARAGKMKWDRHVLHAHLVSCHSVTAEESRYRPSYLGHLTKERFSTCHGVAVAMTIGHSLLVTQHGEMRLLSLASEQRHPQ